MEINAIQNPRQRMFLSKVIEQFSRFQAVLPRSVIAILEFEQVLATQLDDIFLPTAPFDYIGIGVAWEANRLLNPTVVDEQGRDVTTEALKSMPPELRSMFNPNFVSYLMTRMTIKGRANPSDEADLRANGWNPQGLTDMMDDRVRLETQLIGTDSESRQAWTGGKVG